MPNRYWRAVRPRLVALARRAPWMWRAASVTRDAALRYIPPRSVDGVPGEFHRGDVMLRPYLPLTADSATAYLAAGRAAFEAVQQRLESAGAGGGDTWLEIGCGHGRVLRALAAAVGPDRVWGCDVDPSAVRFCQKHLGVHAYRSTPMFTVPPPRRFERVYAISVATHLDDDAARAFFQYIGDCLAPGGAAFFTTHGEYSLDHLGAFDAGAYVHHGGRLKREFADAGHAYVPYANTPNSYGLAWHAPAYVRQVMDEVDGGALELVSHEPHAYEGHQDIWVYRR